MYDRLIVQEYSQRAKARITILVGKRRSMRGPKGIKWRFILKEQLLSMQQRSILYDGDEKVSWSSENNYVVYLRI